MCVCVCVCVLLLSTVVCAKTSKYLAQICTLMHVAPSSPPLHPTFNPSPPFICAPRYGPEPYRLEIDLEFPASMPDFSTAGKEGRIVIELGPLEHVPYSVYLFLEVMRTFKSGAFHRMAGHVTQALLRLGESLIISARGEIVLSTSHICTRRARPWGHGVPGVQSCVSTH